MKAGKVEANLVRLNEEIKLAYISELIELKTSGHEKAQLEQADLVFHEREYERLQAKLEQAHEDSHLPTDPSGASAMNDLLVRLRLQQI
jgi:hypothetical protein